MTREKKEVSKIYNQKIKNMSGKEKENYDFLLKQQNSFESMVRELHFRFFPEEYDWIQDSLEDSNDRQKGKNPMSAEYSVKVNTRREKLGFLPLAHNGMAVDFKETTEYCKKLICKEIKIANK